MLLKSDIENAYNLQQAALSHKKAYIHRAYEHNIKPKSGHIEIVSGIRRCGKSTLLHLVMDTCNEKIAYCNFEDPRIFSFTVDDFQKLDEIIGQDTETYFFDEIQNVHSWELYIRQLHDRGKKVYITGSNASLLSKELGTRLTGRYLQHELFPFSYSEFLVFKSLPMGKESFDEYIQKGGFPEFLKDETIEILQTLLKDIVYRDIVVRYAIKNSKSLMDIVLYLISNIGKEFSYNGLRKTFEVGSANTISDYLSWLEESFVLFYVPRFSWSVKSIVVNPKKVYAIDTGFIQANSLSFTKDTGRLLENAVFLYVRQKATKIYYFKDRGECDFVVFEKEKCNMIIQVCDHITSDNKDREINGLLEAMIFFNKQEGIIVTNNQKETIHVQGKIIKLVPAYEFMGDRIDA